MDEWIRIILIGALPVGLGLFFAIRARKKKKKCAYCRERIPASASVCPYCRRKNSMLGPMVALKSGLGQFLIGLFLGSIIEAVLIAFGAKLLGMFGL